MTITIPVWLLWTLAAYLLAGVLTVLLWVVVEYRVWRKRDLVDALIAVVAWPVSLYALFSKRLRRMRGNPLWEAWWRLLCAVFGHRPAHRMCGRCLAPIREASDG